MSYLLEVKDLQAWYGDSQILHRVNLKLQAGEVLCLVGRNGVGKSSTLKAIVGLEVRTRGEILLEGTSLEALSIQERARRGLAYCPDDRGIFTQLTVRENLEIAGANLSQAHELFPVLAEKGHLLGSQISGGEQQMLAIGRLLKAYVKCLLLDEPTEGVAPVIVEKILAAIARLKTQGYAILLVEQNFQFCKDLADTFFIMDDGQIVDSFKSTKMIDEKRLYQVLGIKK